MANTQDGIITQEELDLLKKYDGIKRDLDKYAELPQNALVHLCVLKDKNVDLFTRRYNAACRVIDLIAQKVGFDPDNCGLWLYYPDESEKGEDSPICRQIEEWLSRSGEKAQLKRRVQELEQENRVLRSLFGK